MLWALGKTCVVREEAAFGLKHGSDSSFYKGKRLTWAHLGRWGICVQGAPMLGPDSSLVACIGVFIGRKIQPQNQHRSKWIQLRRLLFPFAEPSSESSSEYGGPV